MELEETDRHRKQQSSIVNTIDILTLHTYVRTGELVKIIACIFTMQESAVGTRDKSSPVSVAAIKHSK